MARPIVLHRRTNVQGAKPLSTDIETGEIGLNYMDGSEGMFIKNTVNEVVEFAPKYYTDNIISGLMNELSEKQNTLISGSNIKTINGQSILGSGDIVIESSSNVDLSEYSTTEEVQNMIAASITTALNTEV